MAISTQNKIRSIQGYSTFSHIFPLPDASVEAGHLAHVAWLYSGIAYTTATEPPAPVAAEMSFRPMVRPRRR